MAPNHPYFTQFQVRAQPPLGIQPGASYESPWHQPWSLPVRVPIDKRRAVALAASGPFAPILADNQTHPVDWIYGYSIPVRKKPGLSAALQQVNALYTPVQPLSSQIPGWLAPFSMPRRFKRGLRADEQQFLAYHPRFLPPANVTARLAVTEVNRDVALIGIVVYNTMASTGVDRVSVSITEIPAEEGAQTSVEEIE